MKHIGLSLRQAKQMTIAERKSPAWTANPLYPGSSNIPWIPTGEDRFVARSFRAATVKERRFCDGSVSNKQCAGGMHHIFFCQGFNSFFEACDAPSRENSVRRSSTPPSDRPVTARSSGRDPWAWDRTPPRSASLPCDHRTSARCWDARASSVREAAFIQAWRRLWQGILQ